jgi:N-acetylglucosamine-6-phosphate deacetylase
MATDSIPSDRISGRDVRTGQLISVAWSRGLITEITGAVGPVSDCLWIAPPLVDVQVNGYGGTDFQSDGVSREELLNSVRALRRDGCQRFLLTLITDQWPHLIERLKHLRQLREGSDELRRAIAGWHLEGPFLSDQPGYHGAHSPECMLDPTPALLQELRWVAGTDPLLITLAPERAGAIEAIRCAVSLGIKVSLGHTNASTSILEAAVAAGATGFTHLGNACPQALDRHDNILLRVLNLPGLRWGVIPDGIHVSKLMFRLMHQVASADTIYYTTDAMAAAGAPPGRYRLGQSVLEVGSDEVVRKPGAQNFAGSALRPVEGVIRAAGMLDEPWQKAWIRFSDRLTTWMGWEPGLRVGGPAEFCLIEAQPGGKPRLTRVVWEAS